MNICNAAAIPNEYLKTCLCESVRYGSHSRSPGTCYTIYDLPEFSSNQAALIERSYRSNEWQRQDVANKWQLTHERHNHREEVAEPSYQFKLPFGKYTTYPNRFKKPNISTIIPINAYFMNTSRIPPMKHTVPRSFCFRAKK